MVIKFPIAPGGDGIKDIIADVRRWMNHDGSGERAVTITETSGRVISLSSNDPALADRFLPEAIAEYQGDEPLAWNGRTWIPEHQAAPPCVLAIADEWFPARGGVSSLNRSLCKAIAAQRVKTFCVVLSATAEEYKDAAEAGVDLIVPNPLYLGSSEQENLLLRPPLPEGAEPTIIIGHSRFTGPAARVLAHEHYPDAAHVHFIHMSADETIWHRPNRGSDPAATAEERTLQEQHLAENAEYTFAVGPELHSWFQRHMHGIRPELGHRVLRLDPGFDDSTPGEAVPPPGKPQILLLGRLEEDRAKGLDIACRAIGYAMTHGVDPSNVDILLRGSPAGQAQELQEKVYTWLGTRVPRVVVRNYSSNRDLLNEDLRRASLVLMPSRAEGFGLVGSEAISAGLPALISARSGLGMLLRKELSPEDSARLVVPIMDDERDIARWGTAVASILHDRQASFLNAERVRAQMAELRTWSMAARMLLRSVGVEFDASADDGELADEGR